MRENGGEYQDGLLTVRQRTDGEIVRVAFDGELDLANAATADMVLREALLSEKDVVVDLRALEFLDSSGIALLVAAMRQDQSGRLSFEPSEALEVRRVLRLTGLDQKMTPAPQEPVATPLPAA